MIFQSSSLIGLSVIILAWIIQLAYSWNGNRTLRRRVLIVYAVGIALLIIDSYINNILDVAIFNIISLVVVLILLIRISSDKKAKPARRRR